MLGFNCTITKDNLDFLAEVVRLAIQMGADTLQIQHTMFNSPEKVARHNACFTPARVEDLGLDMALPSIRAGGYYQSKIGPEDIPKLQAGLKQARVLAKDRIELLFMPNLPDKFLGPYYLDLDFPFSQELRRFLEDLPGLSRRHHLALPEFSNWATSLRNPLQKSGTGRRCRHCGGFSPTNYFRAASAAASATT